MIASAWLSLATFLALTAVVSHTRLLVGERAMLRWLLGSVEPALGSPARVLDEAFTDASATIVFGLLMLLVGALWGRWAALVFGFAGMATATARLADLIDRPRPSGDLTWDPALAGPGGYPSGHVVYMVLVGGTVGLFAWGSGDRVGRSVAVGLGALIALTGLSRLVVLDHWPADVVGAYLLAWPTLVAIAWLREGPGPVAALRARVEGSAGLQGCRQAPDDVADRRGMGRIHGVEGERGGRGVGVAVEGDQQL